MDILQPDLSLSSNVVLAQPDNGCALTLKNVASLLETGQDSAAWTMLQLVPNCRSAEWHLLRALILFRKWGDAPASRASLAAALVSGFQVVLFLLDRNCLPIDKNARQHNLMSAQLMAAAWEKTRGALNWINDYVNRDLDSDLTPHASYAADDRSYRRWSSHYESGLYFVEQNELKEARGRFKSAVKAAEKIGLGSPEFYFSISALISLLSQFSGSENERLLLVERQLTSIGLLFESDYRGQALALAEVADTLVALKQPQAAETHYFVACTNIEHALSLADPCVNLREAFILYSTYAYFVMTQNKFEVAERAFRRAVELGSQYLGPLHPELVEVLCHQARCLHQMRHYAEESAIRKRIFEVDPSHRDPY